MLTAFTELKSDLGKSTLSAIQAGVPFELGTDASDNAIARDRVCGGTGETCPPNFKTGGTKCLLSPPTFCDKK